MDDYHRIAGVIRYLDEHHLQQPDLAALAAVAGLGPSHFHRLFTRWAGITPKDFLQCLTLQHAKALLAAGHCVLEAAHAAGLSGSGRLHDLCVALDAASPGELKTGGAGWTLTAGFAGSPFGRCLLAESPRGLCHLAFVENSAGDAAWAALQADWPRARLQHDDARAARLAAQVFTRQATAHTVPLRAFVRGTPFQLAVWRALLAVPPGALVSYGQLAQAVGKPGAARAVGSAVGSNPLGFVIPCHRVIRETGALGGFGWGVVRKQAMIAWESGIPHPG